MLRRLFVTIAASLTVLFFAQPALTLALDCNGADANSTACQIQGGANTAAGGNVNPDTASNSVSDILKNVINIFSLVIGIIAVFTVIIGGLNYITSGGDDGRVANAKKTILYAVIGLIIVAFAQVIVKIAIHTGNTNSNTPVESSGSGSTGSTGSTGSSGSCNQGVQHPGAQC